MKKIYLTLAAFFAGCTIASAQMISGTVTSIDPAGKTVTLRQSTGEDLTVSVNDAASLSRLKTGSEVNFNANGSTNTGWRADSVQIGSSGMGGTNTSSVALPAGVNANAPVVSTNAVTTPPSAVVGSSVNSSVSTPLASSSLGGSLNSSGGSSSIAASGKVSGK